MKKVFVVIVNWNGKTDTYDCLTSLKKSRYRGIINSIVIDNNSSDDPIVELKKSFPDVHFVKNKENVGFTGANNQGIRLALEKGAGYIFLLNNDTIVSKDCIFYLVSHLEASDGGVVGPKIYFAPHYEFHKDRYKTEDLGKVIWYGGGKIDWVNVLVSHRGVDEIDRGQYDKVSDTDFVSGCAMLAKADTFQNLGFFDERYYLYYEDIDLCLRLKKAEMAVRYVPQAFIWHKNAGSSHSGSRLQDYFLTRNRILFGMTYAPLKSKVAILRESLRLLLKGRPWQKKGIQDAFLGRWGKGSYG